MSRHIMSQKNPKVSCWGLAVFCIMVMLVLIFTMPHDNPQTSNAIVMPQNPSYSTLEEVVTITYSEPYNATIQYYVSEEKIITDTEYLLTLLADDWDDSNFDMTLARGMDSVGKEHLAIAKTVGDKYEIRAYQDVGLDYFAYVTVTCDITEHSLGNLYAGIEHVIRSYEKEHREIVLN